MQNNNFISPKERLMIAASLIQPQWHGSETDLARYALIQADALIKESGCIVEGAEAPEYAMD